MREDEMNIRHKAILKFIRSYQKEHQFGPSIRDIAANCDLSSTSHAEYHLQQMEHDGLIRRTRGVARSITAVGR